MFKFQHDRLFGDLAVSAVRIFIANGEKKQKWQNPSRRFFCLRLNFVKSFDLPSTLRSGQIVSRYVNDVLKAVLRLQANLLSTPNPITEANTDLRWNCFQLNILSTNLGWEGSAADSRVLRDAINRSNGLRIPNDERLDACEIISHDVQKLDMFFNLTHDDRLRWVMRLLSKNVP